MLIQDKVYGNFCITEPIFIELINCPTLQRLKGISQQGMPREYYHREVFSRFDHSMGVFLLLRKLGADSFEQIAGLLHDVSHTAFSHVIDWVIGDPSKEDYQDNIFSEVLRKSEISVILEKQSVNIEKIVDLESFTLLEQEAPGLCADRIDYSLRELIDLGYESKVKQIVDNLTVKHGQIVFKTKEVAEKFGRSYAGLQREHWAGNEAKARYHILANILRIALDKRYLSLEDFSKTDNEVIDILKKTENKKIEEGLKKLKSGFVIHESNENEGILLKKKFRYVDPEVLIDEEIKKLSSISDEYKRLIAREFMNSKNRVYITIN